MEKNGAGEKRQWRPCQHASAAARKKNNATLNSKLPPPTLIHEDHGYTTTAPSGCSMAPAVDVRADTTSSPKTAVPNDYNSLEESGEMSLPTAKIRTAVGCANCMGTILSSDDREWSIIPETYHTGTMTAEFKWNGSKYYGRLEHVVGDNPIYEATSEFDISIHTTKDGGYTAMLGSMTKGFVCIFSLPAVSEVVFFNALWELDRELPKGTVVTSAEFEVLCRGWELKVWDPGASAAGNEQIKGRFIQFVRLQQKKALQAKAQQARAEAKLKAFIAAFKPRDDLSPLSDVQKLSDALVKDRTIPEALRRDLRLVLDSSGDQAFKSFCGAVGRCIRASPDAALRAILTVTQSDLFNFLVFGIGGSLCNMTAAGVLHVWRFIMARWAATTAARDRQGTPKIEPAVDEDPAAVLPPGDPDSTKSTTAQASHAEDKTKTAPASKQNLPPAAGLQQSRKRKSFTPFITDQLAGQKRSYDEEEEDTIDDVAYKRAKVDSAPTPTAQPRTATSARPLRPTIVWSANDIRYLLEEADNAFEIMNKALTRFRSDQAPLGFYASEEIRFENSNWRRTVEYTKRMRTLVRQAWKAEGTLHLPHPDLVSRWMNEKFADPRQRAREFCAINASEEEFQRYCREATGEVRGV